MSTQVFSESIVIGQRVHCILYGGKDGIVVQIHGNQSPQNVKPMCNGLVMTGGSADFDIIWKSGSRSLKIPESLMRGSVQWRVYPEVASSEEIAQAYAQAAIFDAKVAADKVAAEHAYRIARETALQSFPYLELVGEGGYGGGKHAAKNVRIELKKAWPEVKFSVRSDHNSLNLGWTDGPTQQQVETLIGKYRDGRFDSMEDIERHEPTAFTNLFGGARYISYSRNFSDELVQKGVDAAWGRLGANLATVDKPTGGMAGLSRSSVSIPHLDRTTVRDVVMQIVSAWDACAKAYVHGQRFTQHSWVVFETGSIAPLCNPLD